MYLRSPLLLLIIVCAFANLLLAQQADSLKKLPPAQWARVRTIDVQHLAIDLRFNWAQKQAYGTTTLTLAPLHATDKISLDAAYFTIQSITLSNGKSLHFDYDGGDKNDNLRIKLDRTYAAGESLTIQVNYHTNWVNESDPNNIWGSNGKGIRFFEPTSTEPRKRRQIWSMADYESNRFWFPGYDAPNDFRSTEFTATVDKNLMAISNGSLVESKTNSDGTHSFHWKMDQPYANYQTSFVVGEYVDIPQHYEGITMHNFAYPDEIEAVKASVVRLPDMIKFFSEKTGVKYPYPSYSQVFVQDLPWGMACNSTVTQTENMIDDEGTHADFFYLWDWLEAESLAHQWFGNYLTCSDWSQIWLNRGFAHYFNGLYSEHKNGHEEFLLYNHYFFNQNTYLNDWNAGIRHPMLTQHYESGAAFTSDNYPNFRGALVLQMLRKHLGEENWWKAIRLYVQSNANQPVSTEDFRKAIEAATGEPMDWFFDQWLYKMGHPIFEVTKHYDPLKKELTLTLRQTQIADSNSLYPQADFFQGKMEIEIDGRIEPVWIAPKYENALIFAAENAPKLVNVDYESSWIKEIKFEKSLDELIYQLQRDKDVLGKRWAMAELVIIAKKDQTAAADKAKIYAAFRQIIGSNMYWRIKYMALLQLQGLLAPATESKGISLDEATVSMLLSVIKNEKSWNRAAAITFLGATRDPKYGDLYLQYFNDPSDRVINSAANALGKSKSPKAFEALSALPNKASWKNQSLISALNGLKELRDPRALDLAVQSLKDPSSAARWTLATPVWDFRIAAAETLVALGKGDLGYPIVLERFKKSMLENDVNDIFSNVLLIATLADPRGQEVFDSIKEKFKDDANAMTAVTQFEMQFKSAIQKP